MKRMFVWAVMALMCVASSWAQEVVVKTVTRVNGESKAEIDYPVNGNPLVVNEVRNMIGKLVINGDDTKTAYIGNDADQVLKNWEQDTYEDWEGRTRSEEHQLSVKMVYQDSKVVTFEVSTYAYMGGAHGMASHYGITYLKATGEPFTMKMLKPSLVRPYMVRGLKKYFEVKTTAELNDMLFQPVSKISLPSIDPWIVAGKVCFIYGQYEIAPYAAGMPEFSIPTVKITPMLTPAGKAYF